MTSEKQLNANRANATRGTGPKSTSGKARSRMNSCKHGLTGQTVVIGDEDPAQFDLLRKALEEEFEPSSLMERELIERLAGVIWRLRRIPKFEAALIEARRGEITLSAHYEKVMVEVIAGFVADKTLSGIMSHVAHTLKRPEVFADTTGLALIRDGQHQDTLGKLSRHEASLMNALTKTLQMLHFVQSQCSAERNQLIEAVAIPSNGDNSAN